MVFVVKNSGERQQFDQKKVEYALIRSGANPKLAREVAWEVESQIFDGISTSKVYQLAFKILSKHDNSSATRFGLKLAIMRLGPTGFPFEKYMSRVLDAYGYNTMINQNLMGTCVEHEVDIVAQKDEQKYMVECKYHNQLGIFTGLKEALYTQARFEDLADGGHSFTHPWIICNTKITSTAIQYGTCKNMKMTAWGYPEKENLQDLIEAKRLYPMTILRTVTDEVKNKLARHDLLLTQDLLKLEPAKLSKLSGISEKRMAPILDELHQITNNITSEK